MTLKVNLISINYHQTLQPSGTEKGVRISQINHQK